MTITEQVELNRVNFTNVVIFNNKNFELLTAATFLLQHIIFFYHYLKKLHESFYQCYQLYYFFKMTLSNFYAILFSTLETFVFFSKPVLHNIKVCSHYNFLNHFFLNYFFLNHFFLNHFTLQFFESINGDGHKVS